MKIYIGPYKNWVGPYQISDFLFKQILGEDRAYKIGEWLAEKTPLEKICQAIYAKIDRKVKIKIHKYDTWSMDSTLAMIVLPMLKQLKATKHGSAGVDDEDVPEELRSTSAPPKENDWDIDEKWHARWEWVMEQMIWSFEQMQPDCDWESKFHTGVIDYKFVKTDDGMNEMVRSEKDTSHFDREGYIAFSERISLGLKLFGKYYRGLWD